MHLPDIVGLIGVATVLIAYSLLQGGYFQPFQLRYSLLNLMGSVCILISLVYGDWNLSAALVEVFWALISIYGVVKRVYYRGYALIPLSRSSIKITPEQH